MRTWKAKKDISIYYRIILFSFVSIGMRVIMKHFDIPVGVSDFEEIRKNPGYEHAGKFFRYTKRQQGTV